MLMNHAKKYSLTMTGWFLYLVLFPFYFFESGMPQPADWLLAVMIFSAMVSGARLIMASHPPVAELRNFVGYVILVNTVWAFFIDQTLEKRFPSYFHSLFYVFNFLTFSYSIHLFLKNKKSFLLTTAYGAGISMIVQVVIAVITGSYASRNPLFFNNPNQLGYYALVAGTILVFLARYLGLPVLFQICSYLSFLFLTLLSSSKAAMAGAVVLIVLSTMGKGLLNVKHIVVFLTLYLFVNYFISYTEVGMNLFNYAFNRFFTIGESRDDTFEGRGYDRMLNNPEFMILGAGEGGYYRFDTLLNTGEIHSSFGTILFCYGIIGLILFIRFMWKTFSFSRWIDFVYFIPVFVYSVTHQGLRSTMFWALMSIFYCVALSRVSFFRKRVVSYPLSLPHKVH